MSLSGGLERAAVAGASAAGTASLVIGATARSNTAAWLAFSGALFVAVLTAIFADRRQDAALSAERHRLQVQLAHDRRITDIADLWNVLERALDVCDEYQRRITQYEPLLKSGSPTPSEVGEALDAARDALVLSISRLEIRVGGDDSAVLAHRDLLDALERKRVALDNKNVTGFRAVDDDIFHAFWDLVAAATRRVGSMTD